ncbi:MAG TPA: ABC transporter ATP-binding protein/permease [Gemmatimonadaceae bacterium]|nr:ABC transporter ATP-binding protein/permease [Gemmatimonadaceae bacterium]
MRLAGALAPTWRERLEALRHVPMLLRLVWETDRRLAALMVLLRLVQSVVPVATLWVGKLIIDTVLALRGGPRDYTRLWELVALEIGIVIASEILSRVSSLVEGLLGDQFSNHTSIRLMQHAASLDLEQLENPELYDELERARQQTTGRLGLLRQLLAIGQDFITLVSLAAALLVYSPLLVVLLVVAVLPAFAGEAHFGAVERALFVARTPERRQLDYLRLLGASERTAKEVQSLGLARWIIARFKTLADRFYEDNKRLAIRRTVIGSALSILGTLGYYVAYVVILARTVTGALTLGTLTLLAGSFARSRDVIERLLLGASGIYTQTFYLKDFADFFATRPKTIAPPGAPVVPRPIRQGFVFEDVGFRYPGSDRWAVRHVSFALRPGERIALVGENGAGKTTITKLVNRLYDPSEGRVLLDGRDLREYDVASLRAGVGVIFQDFVRFDMRLDENIAIGEIERERAYIDAPRNGNEPPRSIVEAADKSLAVSLLPRMPAGYAQMLGRRFQGGVELSGGEWQKIALARAYMSDAELLVLDEPTAALDARAEYEVFLRFSELIAGRMAILISHRFSTVRMADRILVLRHGAIEEQGTHEELVAAAGLYAELFEMQAAGYR